jgi:hypothetical protein
MKIFLFLFFPVLLISCTDNDTKLKLLQAEINNLNARNDSLQNEIKKVKPGLGNLMLMIQVHHNKLWFAGKNNNWPLAKYEHDEMMEILKQAEEIEKDRNEVKLFKVMLYPQLDSIQKAINLKNADIFSTSFYSLTNACNNCHTNTIFDFNRIKIPEQPPYSNQEFAPSK